MSGIPWSEILISLLLLVGTFTTVVGATGLIKFPDVYNRLHATGKNSTLGITAILVAGTIFFSVEFGLTLKLLLAIPFLFWTGSAGVHMIAGAAHRTGPDMAPETIRDDLEPKAGVTTRKE